MVTIQYIRTSIIDCCEQIFQVGNCWKWRNCKTIITWNGIISLFHQFAVNNPSYNLARYRSAVQSSSYIWNNAPCPASLAVDGDTQTGMGHVAHNGDGSANGWWMVDLGGKYRIIYVKMLGRSDCCCECQFVESGDDLEMAQHWTSTGNSATFSIVAVFIEEVAWQPEVDHVTGWRLSRNCSPTQNTVTRQFRNFLYFNFWNFHVNITSKWFPDVESVFFIASLWGAVAQQLQWS